MACLLLSQGRGSSVLKGEGDLATIRRAEEAAVLQAGCLPDVSGLPRPSAAPRILVARSAGFCMGVRRALHVAVESGRQSAAPLYTLGPLVHNHQVVAYLERLGIHALDDWRAVPQNAAVIIRAHGVPPHVNSRLAALGARSIDATCPRVRAVQKIVERNTLRGLQVFIVGDRHHPEVVGLVGYSGESATVIEDPEGLVSCAHGVNGKPCLVAQTTMDRERFLQVARALRELAPAARIYETICPAMQERQVEVRALALDVNAMIVVGGKQSANTLRLAQISRNMGAPTFHVETERDLDPGLLRRYPVLGVTAGASTPDWVIKKVVRRLEGIHAR